MGFLQGICWGHVVVLWIFCGGFCGVYVVFMGILLDFCGYSLAGSCVIFDGISSGLGLRFYLCVLYVL